MDVKSFEVCDHEMIKWMRVEWISGRRGKCPGGCGVSKLWDAFDDLVGTCLSESGWICALEYHQ